MQAETIQVPFDDVASLLPHSGHMVLINRVVAFSDGHLKAEAHVGAQHMLLQDGVLPMLACIEIMAQGIGAYAGAKAREVGEPVRLGYLLGTRKLELLASHVEVGADLLVSVVESMQDSTGFGVFDCEMWQGEQLLARAALNVYSPRQEQV